MTRVIQSMRFVYRIAVTALFVVAVIWGGFAVFAQEEGPEDPPVEEPEAPEEEEPQPEEEEPPIDETPPSEEDLPPDDGVEDPIPDEDTSTTTDETMEDDTATTTDEVFEDATATTTDEILDETSTTTPEILGTTTPEVLGTTTPDSIPEIIVEEPVVEEYIPPVTFESPQDYLKWELDIMTQDVHELWDTFQVIYGDEIIRNSLGDGEWEHVPAYEKAYRDVSYDIVLLQSKALERVTYFYCEEYPTTSVCQDPFLFWE